MSSTVLHKNITQTIIQPLQAYFQPTVHPRARASVGNWRILMVMDQKIWFFGPYNFLLLFCDPIPLFRSPLQALLAMTRTQHWNLTIPAAVKAHNQQDTQHYVLRSSVWDANIVAAVGFGLFLLLMVNNLRSLLESICLRWHTSNRNLVLPIRDHDYCI